MRRALLSLTATAVCGLGLLTSPSLAAPIPCSPGNGIKIFPIPIGGADYELKVSCKGSWNIEYAATAGSFKFVATESGNTRQCQGVFLTVAGGADMDKGKTECSFSGSDRKVKAEFKKK